MFPDAAFDCLFVKGFKTKPKNVQVPPATGLSDHHLVVLQLP